MNSEQTIFVEALERDEPAERSAYLDEACAGDAALRRRVEALLRSHAQAGTFLGKSVPERLAAAELPTQPPGDAPTDPAAKDRGEPLDFLEPSDQPGTLGRLGHYAILEVVGRGGMGIVLKAFDDRLRRVVAVKVMAPQVAASAVARQRFIREAQAAAAVRHEHVIDIHAVDEARALPYLVMEYIAGVSLQERLERTGPLQVKEILRIGLQAARGLAAAHAQGLVHRDIKPANILLENHVERVKLTDFGLARAVDDVKLTQTGVVAGSPQYMSPEQAEGRPVDQRTDLFSLGSVLYALCTGQPPYRAPTTLATLKRVCEETPRPIRETNPEVPPWLEETIARLHAKDPAQRIQTAAEVAQLLETQLAGLQQPSAGPAGKPTGPSRRRWPTVAAALLVLAVGLGLMEAAGVTRLVPALQRAGRDQVSRSEPEGPTATALIERDTAAQQTQPAVAPQALTPPAETQPFVILARSGQTLQKLDTLTEALHRVGEGDTIEVRANGPFHLERHFLKGPAIRIRAGEGFRPVFLYQPQDKPPYLAIINSYSRLVLEGLEFQTTGPYPERRPGMPAAAAFVHAFAPLYLANCRFVGRCMSNTASEHCYLSGSPSNEVRNCQFLGEKPRCGISVASSASFPTRTVLENNVVVTTGSPLHVKLIPAAELTLQLIRNTFTGYGTVSYLPGMGRPDLSKSDPVAAAPKSLRIEATGNIFDAQHDVFAIVTSRQLGERTTQMLQERGRWQGTHNLFAADTFLTAPPPEGSKDRALTTCVRLADWRRFWNDPETASLDGHHPRYQGGAVFRFPSTWETVLTPPEQLTPEFFRLHPESIGHAAGPAGEDMGADVTLVGPGPAYERWKKTPDYQEWLKVAGYASSPSISRNP